MDVAEKKAQKYLETLGFSHIKYEPDGNIPPDFLCNHKIAVEVRRLNQQKKNQNDDYKGLDDSSIPLAQQMSKLFSEQGIPIDDHSWFVFYRYRRPLRKWKNLKPLIQNHLEQFKNNSTHTRTSVEVYDGFELEIFKASKILNNQFFVLGGYSDHDSGGWLLAEMQNSLKVVIADKTKKISYVRDKYPEWWLILVDHIGYSLDDLDRELFRDQVNIEHDWDKIILIDPRDGLRFFEI